MWTRWHPHVHPAIGMLAVATFLFWNTQRKRIAEAIADLVRECDVDVVILAENGCTPGELLKALNPTKAEFSWHSMREPALTLLSRFPPDCVIPHESEETLHQAFREIVLPPSRSILVCLCHLRSKLHRASDSQQLSIVPLSDRIRRVESSLGHSRTLIVGDLNMNPFEPGVVAANGLHAVMSRDIAGRGERTIDGERFPFFYNPMWGLMGDHSPGPPGSYFQWRPEHVCYFWNMFDQVLIRPELIPFFRSESLRIISQIGDDQLLNDRGRPKRVWPDHLPLLFSIDFPQEMAT